MAPPHSVYRSNQSINQSNNQSSTLSDHIQFDGFTVLPMAILGDNYSYLLIDDATGDAAVVDPADAKTVHESINQFSSIYQSKKINLKAIFTTHKHWDHAGGNNELVSISQSVSNKQLTVYGHAIDSVDGCTHAFQESSKQPVATFKLGELTVNVLFTPCHTKGHVCYHIQSNTQTNNQCVFTGDTLFIGGCGKFFEGSSHEMKSALYDVLGKLDEKCAVFCGHEYTVSNLEFATWADSENQSIKDKLTWARAQRAADQSVPLSTLYTTIGEEKQINPFLRCDQSSVQNKVAQWRKQGETDDVIATLAAIRKAKDEQAHKKANL